MQESQSNPKEFYVDIDFDILQKDWNKLIQVVEEVESLEHQRFGRFQVWIQGDTCTIQATNRTKENSYSKTYCSPNNKIKAVYESLVLFQDWYNKIK